MIIKLIQKGISKSISSFEEAKKTKQIPLWIMIAYTIYLPFEEYVNGLIPISGIRSGLNFVPEFIFYGVAAVVLYKKFRFQGGLEKTPLDPLIIALIISCLFSVFGNGASPPGSFKNLRSHFRYFAVYYILANINISQTQLTNILEYLRILGLIQSIIACIQFFLPTAINNIISTKICVATAISVKNANCGTFDNNAPLAGLLLICLTLFIVSLFCPPEQFPLKNKKKYLLYIFLCIFAIFSSKKRATLLISFLIPISLFLILKKRIWLLKYLWLMGASILIGSIFSNFFPAEPAPLASREQDHSTFSSLLTEEYWKANAENSRGWMMIVTTKALILSGKIWFGFGPELGIVPRGIEPYLSDYAQVEQLYRNLYVFEDPYWIAVLGYIGLVGLILYWSILIIIYRTAHQLKQFPLSQDEKILGVTIKILIILGLLYSFAERLFIIRPFSFYFWLLTGLTVNRLIKKQKINNQNKLFLTSQP